ncbi:Myb/SANT-like domain-containing protein [Dioscorea alata]|uniref:Myb/SANT-like domain-containing protein n=1 Tax=Dioscorea alata TaxID=55571 RepID=A0ACB7US03_DIOAL|nr:Myb/SANT-like domain-containing protein [Dioscorea alata]
MASRRFGNQASFTVPRAATVSSSSSHDVEEISPTSSQVEIKKKQVRWSDDIDQAFIDTLLEVVLAGPRRTENGFKSDECTKVVNKVLEYCQVVVGVAHVRARLKTFKTEYKEITELLKTSGFGLDENGRVTADPLVWEKHLQVKSSCLAFIFPC